METVYACSFDQDLCTLIQDTDDQFDWVQHSSYLQGEDSPTEAYRGVGYIYNDGLGRETGDVARSGE